MFRLEPKSSNRLAIHFSNSIPLAVKNANVIKYSPQTIQKVR